MARASWRASRWRVSSRAAGLGLALVALLTFNLLGANPRVAGEGDGIPAALGAQQSAPAPPAPDQSPVVTLGLPAQGRWDPDSWRSAAARTIDRTTLAAEGVVVPEGGNVFAARIVDGPTPAYMLYEAGGGAFADTFYPASSIKVLAAVGALEYAYAAGFTGDAVVDGEYTVADYYDAALRYSSNEDYDELVRIAGVEWLNDEFLPARGYRSTRIQEPYAEDDEVADSPPLQLSERGREVVVPERTADGDYGCDGSNCSNLFELVDSVRRVVLGDELPADERFEVAPADASGLKVALHDAESWIAPGVAEALGSGAQVYSKPGWVSGLDCVDVSLVDDGETGGRYLLGVSAPDDGECAMLAPMAADVLTVVAHHDRGLAVRTDGSVVPVVDGRQQASQP